ncbi:hypothetical protein ACSTHG_23605, partial [Vibrio parahaemolyticus]
MLFSKECVDVLANASQNLHWAKMILVELEAQNKCFKVAAVDDGSAGSVDQDPLVAGTADQADRSSKATC